MTEPLHAEFLLTDKSDMVEAWEFLRAHASSEAQEGRPLRAIFTQEEVTAWDYQRNAYWAYVLQPIAEQAVVNGRRYDRKCWHEYMAEHFLPMREYPMAGGKTILRRQSIAKGQISARAMAAFVLEVRAFAASELGVIFPSKEDK